MYNPRSAPIFVLSQNTKRDEGRKVQIENINAGKAVADVVRTSLGPKAMLKMLMDPMGGIVMTNDGNVILREITVQHPAAKSMIETARSQDEEVGDGTTSVIVLGGEIMACSQQFLQQQYHPTVLIREYSHALRDIIEMLNGPLSVPIDKNDDETMLNLIKSSISTKILSRWSQMAVEMSLKAIKTVYLEENGRLDIDFKNYAKVEKIPGGKAEDSQILNGVMLNKDITHPKMRRYIKNPRIILLDCSLEYKKGESQMNVEIVDENDFSRLLQLEEEFVAKQCADVIALKPDLIFTEKGISDLAQHFLLKAGISAIRRVRKTDNNRIARACGARIVNRTEELCESDVGTACGLFEIKKLGDEYFCFLVECKNPKACTVLLRGASKDILNEMERNFHDAMYVARNLIMNPRIVPGGGAIEMAISQKIMQKASHGPYRAIAQALEIIPKTLAQNCGANIIRSLTALRAKHAAYTDTTKPCAWGLNGFTGEIIEHSVAGIGVWDPLEVKLQVYKTAIETAILLLRIDNIVSGVRKKNDDAVQAPKTMQPQMNGGGPAGAPQNEE